MYHHNLVSQGEADARTVLLCGVEGLEYVFETIVWDAGAIVSNRDVGHAVGQCGTHLDACIGAPFERLGGIAHEIDERERQEMRVGKEAHLGRGVELQFTRSRLVAQQATEFGKEVLDNDMPAHRFGTLVS